MPIRFAGVREVEQLPRGGVAPLRGAALEQPEARHVLQEPVAADARPARSRSWRRGRSRTCRRPVARRRRGTRCPQRGSLGPPVPVGLRRRRRRCRGRRRDGRARLGARRAGVRRARRPGGSQAATPTASARSLAQVPVATSSSPVVPAFERSPTASPVSSYATSSGSISSRAARSSSAAVVGGELEDRVDRHQLHAGAPVELGLSERPRHVAPAVRARAPVAVRVGEQPPVLVEQAVVDGPAVDPDRARPARSRARGRARGGRSRGAPPSATAPSRPDASPGRAATGGRPRLAAPRRRGRPRRRGPTSRPCRPPRRACLQPGRDVPRAARADDGLAVAAAPVRGQRVERGAVPAARLGDEGPDVGAVRGLEDLGGQRRVVVLLRRGERGAVDAGSRARACAGSRRSPG